MPRFTSSMRLISRTAMARFNSTTELGFSPLLGNRISAEQDNVNRDIAQVSGCRNILPAAWYSSYAKSDKSEGTIQPNPIYGQSGLRNYATGSIAAGDLTGVRAWTRPLSPHLPVYKPQSNSTSSILNRVSGVYLTAAILTPYFLCMKVGTVSFTYDYVYQLFFYSSKLIPISAELAVLALGYHVYKGIFHLVADASGSVGKIKRH